MSLVDSGFPELGLTGIDVAVPAQFPVRVFDDFVNWSPMKFLAGIAGAEYITLSPAGGTLAVTGGTWADAGATLTGTYTGYTFAAGDLFVVTSGTGAVAGSVYPIQLGTTTVLTFAVGSEVADNAAADVVGTIVRGDQALAYTQTGLNRVGEWVVLGTSAGSISVTPLTTVDGTLYGAVRLTTTSGDGNETIAQHFTAPFVWSAGTQYTKRPWAYQCRARINSITTARQCFGLGPINTTNALEMALAGTLPDGSVHFYILNGVVMYTVKTSATTIALTNLLYDDGTPVTVVANGVYTFVITWDGVCNLNLEIASGPGSRTKRVKSVSLPAFTSSTWTPSFGVGAIGGAVAPTIDADYIHCVQARDVGGI